MSHTTPPWTAHKNTSWGAQHKKDFGNKAGYVIVADVKAKGTGRYEACVIASIIPVNGMSEEEVQANANLIAQAPRMAEQISEMISDMAKRLNKVGDLERELELYRDTTLYAHIAHIKLLEVSYAMATKALQMLGETPENKLFVQDTFNRLREMEAQHEEESKGSSQSDMYKCTECGEMYDDVKEGLSCPESICTYNLCDACTPDSPACEHDKKAYFSHLEEDSQEQS